jgi:DNA-binding GntR family transcriptional regulator
MKVTGEKTTVFQTELIRLLRGLRREIYSGIRLPKERLVEKDLAEAWSVGRMVVRQALTQLETEGLVVIEPYKGATVAEISLVRILENYQVVSMMEGFAAMTATERLSAADFKVLADNLAEQRSLEVGDVQRWQEVNHRFHRVINLKCGNAKLIDLIRRHCQFTSYWFIVLSAPGRIPINIEEHQNLVEALTRRDPVEARRLVERHIMGAGEYLVEFLRKNMPAGIWRESR